ncbi:MAG: hypothetical protein DFNUSKGM_000078 [Candidatus Fervidibacter sacchari]
MGLRCPNCQGMLTEKVPSCCPYCDADLSKLLTPLETGIMTDFGLALIAGATGLLFGIALVTYAEDLRSPFVLIVLIFGNSLTAWGRAKSLAVSERFGWERFWIVAFCASVGAFWAVLVGLNWVWAIVLSLSGMFVGQLLCHFAKEQWRKERRSRWK